MRAGRHEYLPGNPDRKSQVSTIPNSCVSVEDGRNDITVLIARYNFGIVYYYVTTIVCRTGSSILFEDNAFLLT